MSFKDQIDSLEIIANAIRTEPDPEKLAIIIKENALKDGSGKIQAEYLDKFYTWLITGDNVSLRTKRTNELPQNVRRVLAKCYNGITRGREYLERTVNEVEA